ncbi:DUF1353 domain-containing protein [Vreelandella titanicae]|uniref:DUF1353 domain-containing protein n=1 Tax=Vreelandella titanicae TaxID=664683 RepID=UPI003CFD3515
MRVYIPQPLRTERAPRGVNTPWLKGRATKWMVFEDWWVCINGVWFCVPAGYIFNGSSIPWWLWWLFPPSYAPAWEASALHDLFYSHLYKQVSKTFADAAFRGVMLYDDAPKLVANVFYLAVSRFGKGGW